MKGEAYGKYFGNEAILEAAGKAFEAGEYQFVAEILSPIVFAGAGEQTKLLLADALEQIGYTEESGIRRNVYLTGAEELRVGVPTVVGLKSNSVDVMSAMPIAELLNLMSVKLDFEKADKIEEFDFNLKFNAENVKYAVQ